MPQTCTAPQKCVCTKANYNIDTSHLDRIAKKKKMKSNINKKLQWCPMHRTMGGMVHLTVDGMTGEVSLLARVSSKYSRDFEYKSNIRHEPVFHKHTH